MRANPYLGADGPTKPFERLIPRGGSTAAAAVSAGLLALTVAVALCASGAGVPTTMATLSAEGGAHTALAAGTVELTETVPLAGATDGEDVDVSCELHLRDASGRDAGQVPMAATRVRTRAEGGTVTVPIALDATDLAGRTVVAYVRAETADGRRVFESTDIADDAQAVRLPSLEAVLADGQAASGIAEGTSEVAAELTFSNLEPGVRHELSCALVDADTGAPVTGAGMGAVTFVAEQGMGTRELTLHVPERAGRRLRLEAEVRPVGGDVCARLGDAAPTTGVPTLEAGPATTATDATDGMVTVTRTVRHEGLAAGTAYTLASVALDADTGEPLPSPAADGARPEVEIIPTEGSGTIELTYRLDVTALEGRVAFVDELREGKRVLSRLDGLADGTGTDLPRVRSTSSGAHTGMAAEPAREGASIACTLSYAGLEEGAAYEAEGTLSIVSGDGTPLGALASPDGTPVRASAPFVADAAGTISLAYDLDASTLAGSRLRASERILRDGVVVAETTSTDVLVPRAVVTATDATTGLREVLATSDTTIAARVAVEGAPDGEPLSVLVTLVDAGTGRAATDAEGRGASATYELVATGGRAEADVTIPVDARDVAGELVAVATVEARGREVATTADTWDETSRVRVPALTCTLSDGETGSQVTEAATSTSLVATVACGAALEAPHSVELSLVDADTGGAVTDATGAPVTCVLPIDTAGPLPTVGTTLVADTSALAGHAVALEARLRTSGAVTAVWDGRDASSRVTVEGDAARAVTHTASTSAVGTTSTAVTTGTSDTRNGSATGTADTTTPGTATSTPATGEPDALTGRGLLARVAACVGCALAASGALVAHGMARRARGRGDVR